MSKELCPTCGAFHENMKNYIEKVPGYTPPTSQQGWELDFRNRFQYFNLANVAQFRDKEWRAIDIVIDHIKGLLADQAREIREKVGKVKLHMDVDQYLEMVRVWDGKNFDEPFERGFNAALDQVLALPTNKE